jgi:transposase-like protein
MNKAQEKKLKELAGELAKDIKTGEDLSSLSARLMKLTVEAALGAEMEDHLGYSRHSREGHHTGNSRNGATPKTLKGDHGEVRIETPRDRNGTFTPEIVKKGQTRVTGMDEQILCLYAKGLSTRDIVEAFGEMYGAEVSAGLVSQVTNAVIEQVREWQERPLDAVYPIVYLDCIVLKIRQDKRVIKKSIYLALGINIDGHKELLGMWISENEGAKFWLSILTELKNRGLEQMLIACVDGLSGFPEAIEVEYPQAKIQLCIIHMVRNSLRYVSWKDYKAVTAGLKSIYQSATETEARGELEKFAETWDGKYPQIAKSWANHWPNLITIFDYPEDIRKAIYTTNAIESLNSVIRKATKKRKVFPTDDSALKVVYLATQAASKKWTMPIRNWKQAMNRFLIEFEEQLAPHL